MNGPVWKFRRKNGSSGVTCESNDVDNNWLDSDDDIESKFEPARRSQMTKIYIHRSHLTCICTGWLLLSLSTRISCLKCQTSKQPHHFAILYKRRRQINAFFCSLLFGFHLLPHFLTKWKKNEFNNYKMNERWEEKKMMVVWLFKVTKQSGCTVTATVTGLIQPYDHCFGRWTGWTHWTGLDWIGLNHFLGFLIMRRAHRLQINVHAKPESIDRIQLSVMWRCINVQISRWLNHWWLRNLYK